MCKNVQPISHKFWLIIHTTNCTYMSYIKQNNDNKKNKNNNNSDDVKPTNIYTQRVNVLNTLN